MVTEGGPPAGLTTTTVVSGSSPSAPGSPSSIIDASSPSSPASVSTTLSSIGPNGQPLVTITVSLPGQTTIIQGQTITITQASGTLTVTEFQNGTVTIAGHTITVQGPTVTVQGPTVTAEGPTQTVTMTVRPGSTMLPNCPHEIPGRVFDSPYGGEYEIYCGYAYQDPDYAVVTSSSLGSCAQACDAYNIQHFYDTTTCAGVTFFNATGECHLKANMTTPYATNGADSAQLENPYKGGVTQVFASTTSMGPMGSGPTVTQTSAVAGYTPETLVNCPRDNGTVVTAGAHQDAFLIGCGINRPGADLPEMPYYVSSFRSCIDACANNPECLDSTFFPSNAAMNPCYLKDDVPAPTKDDTCWNARLLTGPTCPRDDGKLYVSQGQNFVIECYTDHVDCNFANMPILTSTFGACMDLCAANEPQCADASWTPGTPQGACTLKSCVGAPIANQTDVWGGRLLNGTGGGSTVTTVQTVPTTILSTEVRTVLVSVTTTVTLTTTASDGAAATLTSTQTLVSTQTAPVATETVTSDRLVTTTLVYPGAGAGGNGSDAYPNATATVTATLGSGYVTVTVTVFPGSSSSTFSCLTHMTNYLPASASGGFRVKRNEFLFPEVEVRRREKIGARTARPELGSLGWLM